MDKTRMERDGLAELYDSLISELENDINANVAADDLLTKLDEFKSHKREVLGETESTYA
ncbi:MAG: hypothetical protein ACPGRT_01685 [Flavobacteriaceae bacterium]